MSCVLIAGLGNPTEKYSKTRHNVGWRAIDFMSERLGKIEKENDWGLIKSKSVLLLKPGNYMNNSGTSVKKAKDFYKCDTTVIVHDDISLSFGEIKLKNGGHSGHNGLKSIIEALGNEEYLRIRVGIGNSKDRIDYVLSDFSREEEDKLPEIFAVIDEIAKDVTRNGVVFAMNKYNRKE